MKMLIRYTQIALSVGILSLLAACNHEVEESNSKDEVSLENEIVMAQPTSNEANLGPHGVPEEECYICNVEKREKGRLWCKEHNRYEDRCFICHPELKDKKRLWCKEHFLYEDECYLCHPDIKENKSARIGEEEDSGRLFCKEHGVYEDECTICHPELAEAHAGIKSPALFCKEHQVLEDECGICHPELAVSGGKPVKIRFGSEESTNKAGVQVGYPEVGSISDAVEVYAELTFNQNMLALISLPVGGIIHRVHVDVGEVVKEGGLLVEVSSIEISRAIGDYLRAIAEDQWREQSVVREKKLREENISSEKDLQAAIASHVAADATLLQARQQLRTLGFTPEQIERLVKEKNDQAVLEVRAPFDGELVTRNAVRGALVEMGNPLFTLVDRSIMWAMLNIPEKDVMRVKKGQKVEIVLDSMKTRVFEGTLTWVASEVDERTRMATGRVEIPNPGGLLKAQTFARARIIVKSSKRSVIIPMSSVQQVEGQPFAFVKLENDLYEARPVTIGAQHRKKFEILSGIAPLDQLVVKNSFVMKSQLLLSRLGAGCVDD